MSVVSALVGSKMTIIPSPSFLTSANLGPTKSFPKLHFAGTGGFSVIECSSRPQKKATAHHRKTRPRKSQAWDIRRGPCVYPPLPTLPPDWSFAADEAATTTTADAESSTPPVETA